MSCIRECILSVTANHHLLATNPSHLENISHKIPLSIMTESHIDRLSQTQYSESNTPSEQQQTPLSAHASQSWYPRQHGSGVEDSSPPASGPPWLIARRLLEPLLQGRSFALGVAESRTVVAVTCVSGSGCG